MTSPPDGLCLAKRAGWPQDAETIIAASLSLQPLQRVLHPLDIRGAIASELRWPQEGHFRAVVPRGLGVLLRIGGDDDSREDLALQGRRNRISDHWMPT